MVIDFHTHIFPEAIVPKTIPFLEQRSGIRAATNGMRQGLLKDMEQVNRLNLSKNEKEDLLGDNAKRLLRLI